jgi:cytochrome c-type biogenesis protein CcmE
MVHSPSSEQIQEQTVRRSRLAAIPLKFLVAGALVTAGVVYLVLTALTGATVYYLTVSELRVQGTPDGPVRVAGVVAPDQLNREGTSLTFAIHDETTGETLPSFQGSCQTFCSWNQVVVEGAARQFGHHGGDNALGEVPVRFASA